MVGQRSRWALVSISGRLAALLPQRSGLPVVPLSVVVGTDVSVVLVPYAGFAQVLGVAASGVMKRVFNSWHAAVAKEVTNGLKRSGRIKLSRNGP